MSRRTDPAGHPLWDDAAAAAFTPLAGEVEADVCVVGLGGSGLSCVREARLLGARVVGLDAGRVGCGAAGRNGGFLLAGVAPFYHDAVARYGREPARALYALTLAELDRIQRETPEGVTRQGSLRIAESPEELADCAEQYQALRDDGFEVEPYEGPEGRGLLFPGDGTFQPLARCRALAAAAEGEGARLFEASAATRIETGLVTTAHGAVRCRHVIVAVDGGMEHLLPELVGRVRSARLQMLATAPTREIDVPRPVYARWGYDYWQQRPDGSIAMGGARDRAGEGEWTTVATPTDTVQDALESRLRTMLGVCAPVTHRWAAIVGFTDDGLPVGEEVRPGVWGIGGYSGTGNVIGALLGRGLAHKLLTGDDAIIRAFDAARPGAATL
ncbi:MAG: dependent oxidoreductase [Gemmatimonadetes bacterium]|nr:dependent oxidoreductase [Gemmatimonadota bacterium]